jgi:hypothetical protein
MVRPSEVSPLLGNQSSVQVQAEDDIQEDPQNDPDLIMYNGRFYKRLQVKARSIEVGTGRWKRTINIKDTYIMNTAREGLAVFNLHDVQDQEYVGIYMGELVVSDRLARSRTHAGERTHHFSLNFWGGQDLCVDGSLHNEYDIKYYVKNGAASLFNAGTGDLRNCTVEVYPSRIDRSSGRQYGLKEEGKNLPRGTIAVWILLKAKGFLPARTQLRWDYRCDALEANDSRPFLDQDDAVNFQVFQPSSQ